MTPEEEDILYLLALGHIPGVGEVTQRQLISYFGTAKAVIAASKAKLLQVPGIGEVTADQIAKSTLALKEAELLLHKAQAHGDRVLSYKMADYPKRLRQENDAPPIIFVAGHADLNPERTVSIVGTRNATPYGEAITREIVEFLKDHQVTIISGLAVGIDYHAHKAAVEFQVPTFGIMANGLDKVYPRAHKSLTKEMVRQNGALITEHPYGTLAEKHFFVARNRIIAGLSDLVIVVEAAIRGGALITAEMANDYNKDVMAVPGQITQTFSAGCNKLIFAHKAHCLCAYEDILAIMNWDVGKAEKPTKTEKSPPPAGQLSLDLSQLHPQEADVYAYLHKHPQAHVDEICRNTAIPISQISGVLLNLEFQGLVRSLPGKKFTIT